MFDEFFVNVDVFGEFLGESDDFGGVAGVMRTGKMVFSNEEIVERLKCEMKLSRAIEFCKIRNQEFWLGERFSKRFLLSATLKESKIQIYTPLEP